MKTRSKGFTLVELLAVIVILAIIALIATPMILGVIEDARKGSAKSSALGYVEAVEKSALVYAVNNGSTFLDGTYEVEGKNLKQNDNVIYTVDYKGDNAVGTLTISNGEVTSAELTFSSIYEKAVEVTGNNATIKETDEPETEEPEVVYGATKVAPQAGETHKGIVYLDPTNLSNVCNAENSVSTTETKTGCMKWYIYDDSDENNYKLILDHNTTARIKWNDSNSNVAYENSNLYAVVQDLKTTSGWVVNPDLIEASEINTIVGGVSTWNSASGASWFYFEGTGTDNQTKPTYNATIRNKYDWLYNNTYKCKSDSRDYGCTLEDNNTYNGVGTAESGNTYGYWTKTPAGSAGSGCIVWIGNRNGRLDYYSANGTNFGVRPVITISKSIFS